MTEYPDSTIKSCFDAAWLNLEAAQAAATAVQGLDSVTRASASWQCLAKQLTCSSTHRHQPWAQSPRSYKSNGATNSSLMMGTLTTSG